MTARPGGRAVKPGLERRFFAACAAASPLSFGGNKHNLAVEIKRQAGIPPRTWTPSSLRCFIQSLLRRVTLCFPAVLQALPPLHEDREQGRHGLLSLSVPFAYATRPLKLPDPYRSARRAAQTCFLFRTSTEKVRSPKFLRLRTSRAFARKGSAPLRCGCCSLKHKNPGPSELFSVAARRLASR